MSLLRNVVSNTYKERKYPGRFGRQTAQPESPSDHDSDEKISDEDDQLGLIKLTPWKRSTKERTAGLQGDVLDSLKGLSIEEQFKKLNNDFNFYAIDLPQKPHKTQDDLQQTH